MGFAASFTPALSTRPQRLALTDTPWRARRRQRCQVTRRAVVEREGIVEGVEYPDGDLTYKPLKQSERFWTSCRLFFALPWRKFKKGSVLTFNVNPQHPDC